MEKLFHANRNDKSGGHGIVRQTDLQTKAIKKDAQGTLYNDKRVDTRSNRYTSNTYEPNIGAPK